MKNVNTYCEIRRNYISCENNFDLIRLLAALQVLLGHGINHLQILGYEHILNAISFFHGVIIFFVISGFLITRSYITKKYQKNRGGIVQYCNILKIDVFGFFQHCGLHLS